MSGYVVQRPLNAVNYLLQKVIGPKRPGAVLVGTESLSDLIEQRSAYKSGQPGYIQSDAARIRVSYTENGVRVEEDFYTLIDYARVQSMEYFTPQGVENYRNPGSGEIMKLPGHYQNVWRAGDGNLLFTNDPLVDPNIGSNIDWVKLARVGF